MENVIKFSYNWNNKLGCKAFTTFRIASSKYRKGEVYKIFFKDNYLFDAQIVDIKRIFLNQVDDYIAYIDTGYSVEEFIEIVRKMYEIVRKMYKEVEKTSFFWILLKRIGDENALGTSTCSCRKS